MTISFKSVDPKRSDTSCPACLEESKTSEEKWVGHEIENRDGTMEIGHLHCRPCILKWFGTKNQAPCPMCQRLATIQKTLFEHLNPYLTFLKPRLSGVVTAGSAMLATAALRELEPRLGIEEAKTVGLAVVAATAKLAAILSEAPTLKKLANMLVFTAAAKAMITEMVPQSVQQITGIALTAIESSTLGVSVMLSARAVQYFNTMIVSSILGAQIFAYQDDGLLSIFLKSAIIPSIAHWVYGL